MNISTRPNDEPTPDYLTPDEISRLQAELEPLFKVCVIRMMNNATVAIPGATAAIRTWLEEAEAENEWFCEQCGAPAPEPPMPAVPWDHVPL